ncbi:metallo-beta-lactamase domain protein [Oesophagostomum dentatum]|uniref:Metallo-beta-lactamase domain protein n=1 Tax=Oesophagostomum dentatum TaxID=61180 RepID=A0A0B1T9P9_OESDE|nr:metallo-beta-lactamase domain protein [Oesophagostomum dentatum]
MLGEDYAYCRASAIGDCPVGYLCDQSFALGKSICCRDNRLRPMPNRPVVLPSSMRPPFNWNTITPTPSPKWNVFTTVKKAPWYIKDRTTWPSVYNRVTSEGTTTSTTTEEVTTTTTTEPSTTTTEEIWSTTAAPENTVSVSVLQAGSLRPLREGQSETVGAITLINDNGFLVLVDTGASSDTERLLQSLSKEGVTLDQINTVVITHGPPSHMGNMNFFAQKPILFHSMEYIGRHVTPTELRERPYRKLSPHIEVWKTPGHTQHDLSVLIHDVASYGTMAIVGDLIPNEALISERRDIMDEEGVWDSAIKRQNANLLICMADWIVPGHGQPFRVLPHYRHKAGCTRLLAQRQSAA